MITKINPMCLIDGYKADHRRQYPEGTEYVYSNFTPRKSRITGINGVVLYGIQYFIKEYLIDRWNEGFFNRPKDIVIREYKRRMDNYLGKDAIPCEHIEELHNLGYLPIKIKALPEGTNVPIGVPMLTIVNTIPKFFWLTNYLETLMSNILWKPITSATTALEYRKRFNEHCDKTGYDKGFIQWQAHDFSFRGMSGNEDALLSGAGHLLSFTGTDTIPAIDFLEMYYNANSDTELVGGSVPATEHSVMCLGEKESEIETFKRLITELYPNGIVSIVSDTWDFWKVISEYLPALKTEILARNGRLVIRPDSGNPVDIICGTAIPQVIDKNADILTGTQYNTLDGKYYHDKGFSHNHRWESDIQIKENPTCQEKGAYEMLWDIFGGTINEKGYKVLHPSIGMIYGDAISLERQKQILERLEAKGFCASNLVLGIGSYNYAYRTRDTFGMAMKATWGQVNGEAKDIYKDPKTDSGFKKSAKGLLKVYNDRPDCNENELLFDGKDNIKLKDQCTKTEEEQGLLQTIFYEGKIIKETSLTEIRNRLSNSI